MMNQIVLFLLERERERERERRERKEDVCGVVFSFSNWLIVLFSDYSYRFIL